MNEIFSSVAFAGGPTNIFSKRSEAFATTIHRGVHASLYRDTNAVCDQLLVTVVVFQVKWLNITTEKIT